MGDGYGPLELPVPVPAAPVPIEGVRALGGEVVGDPFLGILLQYTAAVLRKYCGAAWRAISPGDDSVVIGAHAWNPEVGGLSDAALPAVFGYRFTGKPPRRDASDWRIADETIALLWVFPLQDQFKAQMRNSMVNAFGKTLDATFFATRDPGFVAADDPDPTAPSYDEEPVAVKLAVPTSTGAVTYSGGALDGARGAGPYGAARGVVVTLAGAPSSFVHGSKIYVTGPNVLGIATTIPLVIDTSRIPGKLYTPQAFKAVTSVGRDAQAGASGTLSFGLRAHQGLGTELCSYGAMDFELARPAAWRPVRIPMKSGGTRDYAAVEFLVRVVEKRDVDVTAYAAAGVGIDQFGAPAAGAENTTVITNPDGVVLASANYP